MPFNMFKLVLVLLRGDHFGDNFSEIVLATLDSLAKHPDFFASARTIHLFFINL